MTQPRAAGASRRAPILERHPEWTAPRLLRKGKPTRRLTLSASQGSAVPPPPGDAHRAMDDAAQLEAVPLDAASAPLRPPVAAYVTLPSMPRAAMRARSRPFVALLVMCALGLATGGGAAALIVRTSPVSAVRMVAPIDAVVGALDGGGSTDPAADARRSITITLPPASGDSELETLLQRAQGELAAQKLEQPEGDNALESYRRLKAKWPEDKRVAQLGGAIGMAFWSHGKTAQSAGNWDKALHDFQLVNSLPPLPPGALASPGTPSIHHD